MKIYISGPITGIADQNEPAFREAENILTEAGYETVVPHDLHNGSEESWEDYMKNCIPALDCEEICCLPGWQDSKGALLERHIADEMGIKFLRFVLTL